MHRFMFIVALCLSLGGCVLSQDTDEPSKTASDSVTMKKKKRRASPEKEPNTASEEELEEDSELVADDKEPNVQLDTEDDARDLLVGIWRMDGRSLPASDDIRRLPKEQQAAALMEERSRAELVYREFAEDGTYKLFLGGQSKQVGRYEIVSAKHNVLEVETTSVGTRGSMSEDLSIEVNSKELKVTDGNSRRFRMFRPTAGFRR